LACRRAKEAQFSGSTFVLHDQPRALDPALAPIFDLAAGTLRAADIKHLVNRPDGWADRFRALLHEARERLSRPPALIVLTGGGSRMDVVATCCRDVFPESGIDIDREPSFSVARGLAVAARQRARVARFHREMVALPQIPDVEQAVREHTVATFAEAKRRLLERLRASATDNWPAVLRSMPGADAGAQDTEDFLDRTIRPYAEKICVRYGIDIELGASVKLTPPRVSTLDYLGRMTPQAVALTPTGSDMAQIVRNPNAARLAYKAVTGSVAAVRQQGLRQAVQQGARAGGKYLVITAAVATVVYGAAWTTGFVIDKRERGKVLALVERAELPDEFVALLVTDLSTQISRAVDDGVAPLLNLVS
jgi:hypothetical protein